MGICDIIPGVSGGTIAFVTGIYQDLLASIAAIDKNFFRYLFTFQFKLALDKISFSFLIPLLLGIFTALVSTARLIHYLLENEKVYTWSFFFGLILASVFYLAKEIKWKDKKNVIFFSIGMIGAYIIVGLIPITTPENYFFLFLCGVLAITAMILPGISGSFILLLLGKYHFVTYALRNPFLADNFLILIVFAVGCLVGLLSFSKLLNYLLNHHYQIMFALLSGFILGALRKIWPWKLDEQNILPSLEVETFWAIGFIAIAFIGVFALLSYSHKKN